MLNLYFQVSHSPHHTSVKGFTLFEHASFGSLYIMACLFDEVAVYKPSTSKPANR